MIRVGKRDSKGRDPQYPGFEKVVVMMKSHSRYYPLSPYYLKDSKGRIMENRWQFSKIYPKVPETRQTKSKYDSRIIWYHPEEVHVTEVDGTNIIDIKYIYWRNRGMYASEAIRYPVGYKHRHQCLGAFDFVGDSDEVDFCNPLNYIEARKKIYVKVYCELARQERLFQELKEKLAQGINLLIIEVDGPCQESLLYYKEKYGVGDDFIEDSTMLVTEENIKIMLNDPKHPFGHGYCLAMALLDKEEEWNESLYR